MILRCGPLKNRAYWLSWHPVFAWLPIQVSDNDCRWLETVERQYTWVGSSKTPYDPVYRAVPK